MGTPYFPKGCPPNLVRRRKFVRALAWVVPTEANACEAPHGSAAEHELDGPAISALTSGGGRAATKA